MAQQGVRFARVHGRIVPIKPKTGGGKAQASRNAGYKRTATLAGISGALGGAGAAVTRSAGSKFGALLAGGLTLGSAGFGFASIVSTVKNTIRAKPGTKLRAFAGNYFAGAAASIGGTAAAFGAVAGARAGASAAFHGIRVAHIKSRTARNFKTIGLHVVPRSSP